MADKLNNLSDKTPRDASKMGGNTHVRPCTLACCSQQSPSGSRFTGSVWFKFSETTPSRRGPHRSRSRSSVRQVKMRKDSALFHLWDLLSNTGNPTPRQLAIGRPQLAYAGAPGKSAASLPWHSALRDP